MSQENSTTTPPADIGMAARFVSIACDGDVREGRMGIPGAAKGVVFFAHGCGSSPGLLGASTDGGAALVAAADLADDIFAVLSRGGRPDLAGDALPQLRCPTLFVVGGYDETVIALDDGADVRLRCPGNFRIVPGASHLFEERGKLDQVATLSAQWFCKHLAGCGMSEQR